MGNQDKRRRAPMADAMSDVVDALEMLVSAAEFRSRAMECDDIKKVIGLAKEAK